MRAFKSNRFGLAAAAADNNNNNNNNSSSSSSNNNQNKKMQINEMRFLFPYGNIRYDRSIIILCLRHDNIITVFQLMFRNYQTMQYIHFLTRICAVSGCLSEV